MKNYNEILISAGKFRINLGLERMEAILKLLDNPHKKCKFIHIAGTNGKGSTSKIINDILIEHFAPKAKIGLFTSPHLFSYCERIKINNQDIDENEFNELINKIDNLANKNNIDLTEFELITAVAFYYFAINKVEYAVLEVGLGGKYDATNVIENPEVCVITTIDFDHTQRLGNTIDEIAYQKAGIIKKNSNVVVSDKNLGFKVIQDEIIKNSAKLIDIPKVEIVFEDFNNNYAIIDGQKYHFNLLGNHQKDNLALAIGAIKVIDNNISKETIKNALKKVQWKFRIEHLKDKNLIIDGSHNPNGAQALRNFLDDNLLKAHKTFIFGCLDNKDYAKMLEILIKDNDELYFFEFDYPNSLKFNMLPDKFKSKAKLISNIGEIKNIVANSDSLKIICGSIYMLGRIFKNN